MSNAPLQTFETQSDFVVVTDYNGHYYMDYCDVEQFKYFTTRDEAEKYLIIETLKHSLFTFRITNTTS